MSFPSLEHHKYDCEYCHLQQPAGSPRIASQNEESETEHAAEIEKGFTKTEGKCHSASMCSKPFQVNGS